ncbi:MAG: HYR domain-containing protein [Bacteroidota bacterium]
MKRISLILIGFLCLVVAGSAQNNTLIIDGGHVKVVGSSNIVLQNTQFINNGNFDAGTGQVSIIGSATDAQSAIGGSSQTTFFNLQLNKSSNGTQLLNTILVDNELRMSLGNLDLNGNNLQLGTANGIILGESETSRILGPSGGFILKTLSANMPADLNPGNMGLVLSSADNLGTFTLRRGHVPQTVCGGAQGIARFFEFDGITSSNINLNAQFQYFDAELNGLLESNLGFWLFNSGSWLNLMETSNDLTANIFNLNNLNQLSSWTLAPFDSSQPVITCPADTSVNNDQGLCSALVNLQEAMTTDNCFSSDISYTLNGLAIDISNSLNVPVGIHTINASVPTSQFGDFIFCEYQLTVNDTVPPSISCPNDTVLFNDPGLCSATVNLQPAIASDNCGILSIDYLAPGALLSSDSSGQFPVGSTSVIATVRDSSFIQASCSYLVTVLDNEPLVSSCPTDTSLTSDPNSCSALVNLQAATATDNCFTPSISYTLGGNIINIDSSQSIPVGISTVRAIVQTPQSTEIICEYQVTVIDNEVPTLVCATDTSFINIGPGCFSAFSVPTAVANDNCGMPTISYSATGVILDANNSGNFPLGTTIVTVQATDASGNQSSCQQSITIIEPVAPPGSYYDQTTCQITLCPPGTFCPGATTDPIPCPNGFGSGPGATECFDIDECSEGTANCPPNSFCVNTNGGFECQCNDGYQDDGNGNCVPILPAISCPANISVNADPGLCETIVNFTASDTAAAAEVVITYSQDPGTAFAVGTSTVTATATNSTGIDQCSFTITVVDQEGPIISCPGDVTLNNDESECSAIFSLAAAMASDNCAISTISYSAAGISLDSINSGTFPLGNTLITASVQDPSGNSSSCTYQVTVNDTEAPILINCNRDPITVNAAADACGATVDYDDISVDDNCPGASITFASHSLTGDFFPVGTTTVNIQAADAAGNQADCIFEVTVLDSIAPLVICSPTSVQLDSSGIGTISSSDVFVSASDNCAVDNSTLSISQSSFSCNDVGSVGVTVSVSDVNGNLGSCVAAVTVVDQLAPTAVCQAATVMLDANGVGTLLAQALDGGSSDNCGIASFSASQTSFGCVDVGDQTITLTAADASGNSASCSATVTVVDQVAPTAICQDITLDLDASGQASLTTAQIDNGSTDACGVANLSLDMNSFDCTQVGPNTITLTAMDVNGNSNTCIANVQLRDLIAPSMTCINTSINLDASGQATLLSVHVDGGSSDACGIANLSVDVSSFDCSNVGLNTVTLTGTDVNGNSSTCTATVEVIDNVVPLASCQDAVVILTSAGVGQLSASAVDSGSTDACGIASTSLSQTNFSCAEVGDQSVTLTVTDVNGNSENCSATVTVVDQTAPTAVCVDRTLILDAQGQASITAADLDGGSSDACGISGFSASQTSFSCADVGDQLITLTVSDVNGNSASCISTVSVVDQTAPVLSCQDATVTLDSVTGLAVLSVADVQAGIDEACGVASVSIDTDTLSCNNLGSNNLVTLTALDVNGNSNSCLSTVTVVDTTAPTAVCLPLVSIILGGDGTGLLAASATDNGSFDNCSIASFSLSQSSFSCADVGLNNVTLSVTDNSGNSDSCAVTVNVADKSVPSATCLDIVVDLAANGQVSIEPAQVNDGSTDNCGLATLLLDQTDFDCSHIGENSLVLTVVDSQNNADTCQATVTVQDVSAPTLICQDVAVFIDPVSGQASLSANQVDGGSSDNCGISSLTLSQSSFSCAEVGNQVVTLTATDANGNSASCLANVTVSDTSAALLSCQDLELPLSADLGLASIQINDVATNISDVCGLASTSIDKTQFNCADVGDNAVTVTATDLNGNVSSCTVNVQVIDDTAPQALCQNASVSLDANGQGSLTVNQIDNGSNDACGLFSVQLSKTSFDCADVGPRNVTLLVVDANGNNAVCTATVTVADAIAPTAICQDASIQLDALGTASLNTSQIDGGSADNCGIASSSLSKTAFICADVGTQSVILTVVDPGGQSAQCQASVTILDTVAPAVVCKDTTIALDANGVVNITATELDGGSTDACGLAELSIDQNSFGCANTGLSTVTLTATDPSGNTASCTANVTIVDDQAPVVVCTDLQVALDANGQASITTAQADGGTTDNCSFSLSLSQTVFTFDDFPSTTVTLTATDPAGSSTSCQLVVAILNGCNNATDGGEIAATEVSCGNFDPDTIQSISPALGGEPAPLEYLWLSTTDPELPLSEWTTLDSTETYDPDFIEETTYYIRCARRLGCTEYLAESNIVAKIVNDTGEECDEEEEALALSGNASATYGNFGVQSAANLLGPIDGQSAKFYQHLDGIRVLLPDYLPAGSEVTISWKRRDYGGALPARMLVYENSPNGNSSLLNDIFFTTVTDFFVHVPITIQQEGVNSLWIRNFTSYADFEVDAISYCGTACLSDLEYCIPEEVSTEYEYIRRVNLNTIDNWTGDDDGYGDYTELSTDVEQGSNYTIRLRPGFQDGSYVEFWRVWIDFNQNGEFEGYERVYQGRGRNQKVGTVQIPLWARTGDTRMRVLMRYGGYGGPCADEFEGEVEDYTIHIDPTDYGEVGLRPDGEIAWMDHHNLKLVEELAEVISDRSDVQPVLTQPEISVETSREGVELDMRVWPNPSDRPFTVAIQGFAPGEAFELVLLNPFGQLLLRRSFAEGGDQRVTIDPAELQLASGAYLLRAYDADRAVSKRVVVEN